jgi:hypothetical protein
VNKGWDTYDECVVVVAESIEEAVEITLVYDLGVLDRIGVLEYLIKSQWARPEDVTAVFLGYLAEDSTYKVGDVVCASFNAG